MLRRFLIVVSLACAGEFSIRADAGIPEPDLVLYGRLCLNGAPQRADSDAVVTASVNIGGKSQIVGRYQMGETVRAGDFYVLRIQRESAVDGSMQSANTARAGDTVSLAVQRGSDDPIEAGQFTLDDAAGTTRRLDLDNDTDLKDFALLQRCFTGSGTSGLDTECTVVDRNRDDHVDLLDSRTLTDEVAGPCG